MRPVVVVTNSKDSKRNYLKLALNFEEFLNSKGIETKYFDKAETYDSSLVEGMKDSKSILFLEQKTNHSEALNIELVENDSRLSKIEVYLSDQDFDSSWDLLENQILQDLYHELNLEKYGNASNE